MATLVECADRVSARDIVRQKRIKIANAQFERAVLVPAIEEPAQKIAVLLGGDREVCDLPRYGIHLHAGDEL